MSLPDLSGLPLADQEKLRQSPALSAPENITPNFENPPNGNIESRALLTFCIVLTILLATGRFWGTWTDSRRFFLSDAMFVIALAFYMTYMGLVLKSINEVGYLIHQWDIILEDMLYMNYTFAICPILFALVTMFTKVAILLEWLRIFNPTGERNTFFWLTSVMLVTNVLYYLIGILLLCLACRPFAKSYNPFIPGRCLDTYPIFVTSAIINMVLDIGILLLPLHIIFKLQMTTKRKLGVGLVFTFGLLAVICAVYRVPVTIRWINSTDFLYEFTIIGLWIASEMTCGFLVFCMPSIPKAVMGLGLPAIISRLSTIISSRKTKSQSSPRSGPWPSHDSSEFNNYHKLQGQPVPLQIIGGVASGKLRPGTKKTKDYSEGFVLRETRVVTTSQEGLNEETVEEQRRNQHPWAQG